MKLLSTRTERKQRYQISTLADIGRVLADLRTSPDFSEQLESPLCRKAGSGARVNVRDMWVSLVETNVDGVASNVVVLEIE